MPYGGQMTRVAPYGSWDSPITAADLAAGGHATAGGRFVGEEIWWAEVRPAEAGRYSVRRRGDDGEPVDLLPDPWNARTRVHEYGGGAWTVTDERALVFAEFTDQRLHRLDPGAAAPVPLTPADHGFRFAELQVSGDEVLAIRETHGVRRVVRDLVAVPLDGSAADDPGRIRSLVGDSDFLAGARVSPDGRHLAWIAWNHPDMPWDATELRCAPLVEGVAGEHRVLAGGPGESVLQPEWSSAETLVALTDRSGWWNPVTVTLDGEVTPLLSEDAEYGGPLWQLGMRWFDRLEDGRLLAVRTLGSDRLVVLDPATGEVEPVPLPLEAISLGARSGDRVLLSGGASGLPRGLRCLDLGSGELSDVRLDVDAMPADGVLPRAELRTFAGAGREVHAIVYPPRHDDFRAPEGELPPYVAHVHGGPTARAVPVYSAAVAYFTSRGIGVVDVNYGGSTGYGREYRERLRGQWGVVDVEDVVAAVRGLAEVGLADPARLAISGGSAGGWTVLAALTTTTTFAAGASYFGVAELVEFVSETHDFESRYVDGLIGPLPEAADLYAERAPINRVADLRTPVLLLQGEDDPIVPPSQAEMFRDAMIERGIPYAYRLYAGESHGFRRAETIIDAAESELSFYGQVMGFETPGVPVLAIANLAAVAGEVSAGQE